MKFNEFLKNIEESNKFINFKKTNEEAEFCAGFFIIDLLTTDNKKTLDYKVNEKVFTFSIGPNNDILMEEDKLMDMPGRPKLTIIKNPEEITTDLDEIKGIVGTHALNQGIKDKFHKIIAVLQNNPQNDEEKIWNITCILDGLTIIHVIMDPVSNNILKFEKKSMMDMIKKV